MSFQDYNVLIVDDDKTFGESIKKALSKAGFNVTLMRSPEEAIGYARLQDIHVLIIDCMLPKMNGLELVKKLKEVLTGSPYLFLISGIFKDKQFIKSSLSKTGATQFITKPMDLPKFVEDLKGLFGEVTVEDENFNPLVNLYMKREIKPRKLIKLLNDTEGLHNFDLPWVIKLLMETGATGHLNIACTNGDIAGVGFHEGNIVQVNIKNESSLLGLLLVEQGYLDRVDLNEALESNTDNKRIGQFLVEKNYVSPHAISIVLKEQLVWRLKRLIADSQMELNFVKAEEVAVIAEITEQDFLEFIIQTVEHTIREDWLKAHYLPLSQNLIELRPERDEDLKRAGIFPFISRNLPSIQTMLQRGCSMEELLNNNASIENSVLRVIHFLNIMGYLEVTHAHKTLNFSHQAKRLQRLDGELENKNYFERLGVSRSAKEGDIKKAYFDLAKVLHPDKLSSKTPQEIRQLSEKVFEKIQVAYDTLKRSDKRAQYLDDLEAGQSEKLMQGDQLFDSAKALMNKGQFSQARKLLQQAAKLNTNSSEIKVHLLWSELKLQKASEGFLSDTDKKLNLIPIESRDSAAYYHTRGLYYKMAGDIEKAKKYFNTALNVDNTFISARREISQLPTKKDVNIFNADLKDVVGALFKK